MGFNLFGWQIRKAKKEEEFTEADKLACFILMAFTDKVNKLFRKRGFQVYITEEERNIYRRTGKIPYHVANEGQFFRKYYLSQLHRMLDEEAKVLPAPNFRLMPALDADWMAEVKLKTMDWTRTIQGIPYHCLFDYHPLKEGLISDDDAYNRQMVWNFKNTNEVISPRKHVTALYETVIPLAETINNTFGQLAERLTLFCIPASTEDSRWMRYREFSQMLCQRTGMFNSFHHVNVDNERKPVHLGGDKTVNYRLDEKYFYGKAVLVFDDILTTGQSLEQCRNELEKVGAKVIAACFLGHTVKKEVKT